MANDSDNKRFKRPIQGTRRTYIASQYPIWIKNNRLRASEITRLRHAASRLDYNPLISVLVPVYNPEREWLKRALDSVLAQVYPHWELCICDDGSTARHVRRVLSGYERLDDRIKVSYQERNGGISAASNVALSAASGEFVVLLDHDDQLTPDALFEVVKLLQERPETDFVYSDEDIVDEVGKPIMPHFKPDWSPDLLTSYNYITHLAACRRQLVEDVGGFREGFEGSQDYDLFLRLSEKTDKIHHIPKILYHWWRVPGSDGSKAHPHERSRKALSDALERRGIAGTIEDGIHRHRFNVSREIVDNPKISIIVPTKNNVALLKRCVESIEKESTYGNYEVLIVDNDSSDPDTLKYLNATSHRVLPFREEFNYSRINNFAVSHAGGEYVLFLNDDTEVVSPGWLEAMLQHAQRPEVGAVGAKLLYPDGRVQHAGVLVGVGSSWIPGVATHSHLFHAAESRGYFDAVEVIRNYSAVTAACMMVRKATFDEIGGFDEENLPVLFNDVDLCLRIRQLGYLVVYTPLAELYHHESASRGHFSQSPAEFMYMRERWGEILDNDPYYNPNLSLGSGDFDLRADGLRPRVLRTRDHERDDAEDSANHPFNMSNPEAREHSENRQADARNTRRAGLITLSREQMEGPALPDDFYRKLRLGGAPG